ncbi:MAG TPA: phosphate signaling complex protein PhoU [Jiangellales bacterium]|nr:phosphate signaling complex protein PhoU [Jiangellales bacterium]
MREAFHEQLDGISGQLVAMTRQVGGMIHLATEALLSQDIHLADQAVAADADVDRAQLDVDEQIIELVATQAPVAGELREVLSALRITANLERMGDLAAHVAKVVRMRYPDSAVPDELRTTFAAMGAAAEQMAAKAGEVIRTRDLATADQLARDDDEMDRLHRSMFLVVLDHDWPRPAETAVDLALLGRYYERFADHAVLIAGHIRYLVTGVMETPSEPQL